MKPATTAAVKTGTTATVKSATAAAVKTTTAAAVASPAVLGKGRNGQPNKQCERNCGDALHEWILLLSTWVEHYKTDSPPRSFQKSWQPLRNVKI